MLRHLPRLLHLANRGDVLGGVHAHVLRLVQRLCDSVHDPILRPRRVPPRPEVVLHEEVEVLLDTRQVPEELNAVEAVAVVTLQEKSGVAAGR